MTHEAGACAEGQPSLKELDVKCEMMSSLFKADVQWLLDRVKHDEEGSYFPDEQGDLVLRTAQSREVNWAPDAGIISQANDRFFAKPSNIAIHCYMIPDNCKYGFTIAFWFKGKF